MIFTPPPALSFGEYVRLPTRRHVVALTLDAGGNDVRAWQALRAIRRAKIPVTFFLTGLFAKKYPHVARAMASLGEIANHTWDHATLPDLSSARVRVEVSRAAHELESVTGQNPKPIFRFPYGARDTRTLGVVRSLGYVSVRWTVDTLGWTGRGARPTAVARIRSELQPGAIILMHIGAARDGATVDTDVLPKVIAEVRARGYRFVRVADYIH